MGESKFFGASGIRDAIITDAEDEVDPA